MEFIHKNYSLKELEDEAKLIGAVCCKDYFVTKYSFLYGDSQKARVSRHYFNEERKEVAYFFFDTYSLLGLKVLDSPRSWSDEFFYNPNYSSLTKIN